MVEITDHARLKIVELMEKSETGVLGLRLSAESVSPLKINFSLAFITDGQEKPEDTVIPFEGFDLYVDPDSAPNIEKAVVDYVDGLMGSGFKIENPSLAKPELSGPKGGKIILPLWPNAWNGSSGIASELPGSVLPLVIPSGAPAPFSTAIPLPLMTIARSILLLVLFAEVEASRCF